MSNHVSDNESQPGQAAQADTARSDHAADVTRPGRPVVVMIGPMGSSGGMSTAMRQQIAGPLSRRYELVPFDNSKRTPCDRPLWRGVLAQGQLLVELRRLLRSRRPTIVHLHTCSGLTFYRSVADAALARLCGACVVLHVHGGRFGSFLARQRGPFRWIVRRALTRADRVIVLGQRWARVLQRFDSRVRLSVVHNGLALPEEDREHAAAERPTVVCVGNLSRNKSIETLIEAVAGLPDSLRRDLEVRVVGHDPEHRLDALEGLVDSLGLQQHVHFLGQRSPDDVQRELARAWVFALPSRAEALPIALLEAMAQGLPCVATRVGAVHELVRHRREGLLVGVGDVVRFRECLRKLLESSRLRERLGSAARRRVQTEFNPQRVCDGLAGAYRQALLRGGML